jgi:hypothetical protein
VERVVAPSNQAGSSHLGRHFRPEASIRATYTDWPAVEELWRDSGTAKLFSGGREFLPPPKTQVGLALALEIRRAKSALPYHNVCSQ